MAYVYILRCVDGSLYTGITTDVQRRLAAHKARTGAGAKYTRAHPAKEIAALWETGDMRAAARVEWAIKQLPRRKKLLLVADPSLLGSDGFPLPDEVTCRPISPVLE